MRVMPRVRARFSSARSKKDGKNPTLWLNLATAFRKLNLPDDEMKALERLLAIEPRHLLAPAAKGLAARAQGPAESGGQRISERVAAPYPAARGCPKACDRRSIARLSAVRANHAALDAFLADRLRDVRAQHATEPQERFDHCIDAFLGKRGIYHPEPTFLQFPKLPAWEFYRREDFPWLDEIEAATADVRSEFERVFVEDAGQLEPYIAYPEGVPIDQWAALNHSRQWSAYYLWRDGARVDEHLARCPKTAELLSRAPLADVPGYAPTAFFSILDAKTHIPAHTGVTNTRLVVHLPLVIPGGCRFRVGSQTREWQAGRAWVFDDTMQHEAWNDSDVPRAILIFDIWNHLMTPAECDLVRTAVQGIRDFYRGEVSITAN